MLMEKKLCQSDALESINESLKIDAKQVHILWFLRCILSVKIWNKEEKGLKNMV